MILTLVGVRINIAVFTPTRNPGIAVSYYGVNRQLSRVNHWLVADQLAPEREDLYDKMRRESPQLNIETYSSEILPEKNGNLAHVSNWALNRARALNVDLLVFLQDFIWIDRHGVSSFVAAAKAHPFDLITGRVIASERPAAWDPKDLWNIFISEHECNSRPSGPYTNDTRHQMNPNARAMYLSNHAWEINWGALPHALINAGVDFDEDYDYGTQWENTQFSFDIGRIYGLLGAGGHYLKSGGRVWWDFSNIAVAMPHREYFPHTHAGERKLDNGWRFWEKNPDLVGVA